MRVTDLVNRNPESSSHPGFYTWFSNTVVNSQDENPAVRELYEQVSSS